MTTVTPDRILKELHQLWVDIGKSAEPGDVKTEHGILRACAMTLIMAADEEEEAASIDETIAELMHHHPSRAIVLRVRDGADEFLESRVFAQCWMPFGRREQICCEEIEIRSSEASLADVPRIVLALVAPDLPVVLVCRSAAWFGAPSFTPMLHLANRVILDSRHAPQPAVTLREIQAARAQEMNVTDLAWTAVTEWRRQIAGAFDQEEARAALSNIRQITVTAHSGPQAWYLAAWLAMCLGGDVPVEFRKPTGDAAVQEIVLSGDGVDMHFDGLANQCSSALSSDWELLRDELSITGDDRVFHNVLPRAVAFADGGR